MILQLFKLESDHIGKLSFTLGMETANFYKKNK